MARKMLVVLGGKKTDEAVVTHVEELAQLTKGEVTLLRVITVAHDEAGGLGLQLQLEIGSSGWWRMKQAREFLPGFEQRLRRAGCVVETALAISTRSEADEIISYAAGNGYDLVVLASDPRPWYKRWIGGSLAHAMLRKATVPVLFIGDGTRTAPTEEQVPQGPKIMQLFGGADL
jgi:nucleotide-binding universal stress UspA family protein